MRVVFVVRDLLLWRSSMEPAIARKPGRFRRRGSGVALDLSPLFVLFTLFALAACGDAARWQGTPLGESFPALDTAALSFYPDVPDVPEPSGATPGVTLLFFGYLSCPDVCPTTLANLRASLDALPQSQRERVRVVFVSVDPARDSPERLSAYAAWFGPEFRAATAAPAQLRALVARYGSSFQLGEADAHGHYVVAHGSHVLAFDTAGRARLLIAHDSSPEAIADDLRQLLRG